MDLEIKLDVETEKPPETVNLSHNFLEQMENSQLLINDSHEQHKQFLNYISQEMSKARKILSAEYQKIVLQCYSDIQNQFTNKPLYVMFEKLLKCDPRTDHIAPKNIYPLYKPAFDIIFQTICSVFPAYLLQYFDQLQQSLIQAFNEDFYSMHNINEDLIIAVLTSIVESGNFQKLLNVSNGQNFADKQLLRQQIMQLREQLIAKKRATYLYSADLADGPKIKYVKNSLAEQGLRDMLKEANDAYISEQRTSQRLAQELATQKKLLFELQHKADQNIMNMQNNWEEALMKQAQLQILLDERDQQLLNAKHVASDFQLKYEMEYERNQLLINENQFAQIPPGMQEFIQNLINDGDQLSGNDILQKFNELKSNHVQEPIDIFSKADQLAQNRLHQQQLLQQQKLNALNGQIQKDKSICLNSSQNITSDQRLGLNSNQQLAQIQNQQPNTSDKVILPDINDMADNIYISQHCLPNQGFNSMQESQNRDLHEYIQNRVSDISPNQRAQLNAIVQKQSRALLDDMDVMSNMGKAEQLLLKLQLTFDNSKATQVVNGTDASYLGQMQESINVYDQFRYTSLQDISYPTTTGLMVNQQYLYKLSLNNNDWFDSQNNIIKLNAWYYDNQKVQVVDVFGNILCQNGTILDSQNNPIESYQKLLNSQYSNVGRCKTNSQYQLFQGIENHVKSMIESRNQSLNSLRNEELERMSKIEQEREDPQILLSLIKFSQQVMQNVQQDQVQSYFSKPRIFQYQNGKIMFPISQAAVEYRKILDYQYELLQSATLREVEKRSFVVSRTTERPMSKVARRPNLEEEQMNYVGIRRKVKQEENLLTVVCAEQAPVPTTLVHINLADIDQKSQSRPYSAMGSSMKQSKSFRMINARK